MEYADTRNYNVFERDCEGNTAEEERLQASCGDG